MSNALKRNTVETQRFSIELTTALHQALIRANARLFHEYRLELSTWRLDKILAADDWIRADVTCPAVAQSEVFSYSLFPRGEAKRRINDRLDAIIPKLSQFVAVAKLRAYGVTSGNRALVRFVPVLVLKPFNAAIVSEALSSLQDRLKLHSDVAVDSGRGMPSSGSCSSCSQPSSRASSIDRRAAMRCRISKISLTPLSTFKH